MSSSSRLIHKSASLFSGTISITESHPIRPRQVSQCIRSSRQYMVSDILQGCSATPCVHGCLPALKQRTRERYRTSFRRAPTSMPRRVEPKLLGFAAMSSGEATDLVLRRQRIAHSNETSRANARLLTAPGECRSEDRRVGGPGTSNAQSRSGAWLPLCPPGTTSLRC